MQCPNSKTRASSRQLTTLTNVKSKSKRRRRAFFLERGGVRGMFPPVPSRKVPRQLLNGFALIEVTSCIMNVFNFIAIVATALLIEAQDNQAQLFRRRRLRYVAHFNSGCRNRNGGQGSNSNEWSWYPDISRRACQNKCNNLGENCFGYEYGHRHCEVWKTPIAAVEHVPGLTCYNRI